MRQATIVKTYLKFNELLPDQKSKVLDSLRDINTDHDWFDFVKADFHEKLKKLGFYNIKSEFSGFWSQGDGACFTANHNFRGGVYKISHHYSHSNTITSDNATTKLLARRLSDQYYRDLEKNHEYLTSDAAIIETIECNDYEFDADALKLA